MEEIINFDWCEKHNMSQMLVNVASDKTYYLEINKYCCIIYTESSNNKKHMHVLNPFNGKELEITIPKISFKENKRNEFTTKDLKSMCELVGLEYPF